MLLVFIIELLTLVFVGVAFSSINETGVVIWMLRLATLGCAHLNIIVLPWLFINPQRALKSAYMGCVLMLPLMLAASFHIYGIPALLLLVTLYYIRVLQRKEISVEYMMRHTERWRIIMGGSFWVLFIFFVLFAIFLGTFSWTKGIFPIESSAIILW